MFRKKASKGVAKRPESEERVRVEESEKRKEVEIDRVRKRVLEVKVEIDSNFLELAELLYEIHRDCYYKVWGFPNFLSYVNRELDIRYRKAAYLVSVWNHIKAFNLPEDRVQKIGWTKMREVTRYMFEGNIEELLAAAESSTVKELREKFGTKSGKPSSVGVVTYVTERTVFRPLDVRIYHALYSNISEFRRLDLESQKQVVEGTTEGIRDIFLEGEEAA